MMKIPHIFAACIVLLNSIKALAQPDTRLVELINAYRAAPPACEGLSLSPMPPLAPDARLSQLRIDRAGQLPQALRAAGYRASRAEAISMSGPPDAREAFDFAANQHCRMLLDSRYSVIGVSKKGAEWMIVLARPLLGEDLGDWRSAGREVLEEVNMARAQARRCGDREFKSVPPLRWSDALANAALKHSRDMARNNYFAHEGKDGRSVADRVKAEAYRWSRVGENIATGQGTAQQVVRGWLSSPGHCANIMNADFSEMGAAYVYEPASESGIYWTQVFAKP